MASNAADQMAKDMEALFVAAREGASGGEQPPEPVAIFTKQQDGRVVLDSRLHVSADEPSFLQVIAAVNEHQRALSAAYCKAALAQLEKDMLGGAERDCFTHQAFPLPAESPEEPTLTLSLPRLLAVRDNGRLAVYRTKVEEQVVLKEGDLSAKAAALEQIAHAVEAVVVTVQYALFALREQPEALVLLARMLKKVFVNLFDDLETTGATKP